MQQALREYNVFRDFGDSKYLELHKEHYRICWSNLVREINEHNDKYARGEVGFMLRVFCPWEGELYIPRD